MVDDNGLEPDNGVDIEDLSDVQLEENNQNSSTAHDDFDWNAGNKLVLPYTEQQIEAYKNEYDATFNSSFFCKL